MFKNFFTKNRMLLVACCCAIFAARKMLFAITPPGGPASANAQPLSFAPGTDTTKTGTPTTRSIDIPYGDIASILEDDTVLYLVKQIPNVGSDIATSAEALGKLMEGLEQFEADLVKANAVRQELQKMMTCAKAPLAVRSKSETCKAVGCNGNRADCLKKAIADLRIVLHPFIQDIFVGYEKNGKKYNGLAYTVLDIVHQPGAKQELDVVVKPLETALKVLEILEKIAQVSSELSKQKQPAATPAPTK